MGKSKLGDLVRTMAEKAALDGRKVNHSTTVTSLLHSNIEATTVMQLTGHTNVASINEYSTASLNHSKYCNLSLVAFNSRSTNNISRCSWRLLMPKKRVVKPNCIY
jgi:hypothetical protein